LRLLAEKNSVFRDEVYKRITSSRDAKICDRNQYWNCYLNHLCSAFLSAFENELKSDQKRIVNFFSEPRNKLLHTDLIALSKVLGISQDGQEILRSGKRNQLISPDNKEEAVKNQLVKQSIRSFDTNDTVNEIRTLCGTFEEAIDHFLRKASL
jgi:hypothetical protein